MKLNLDIRFAEGNYEGKYVNAQVLDTVLRAVSRMIISTIEKSNERWLLSAIESIDFEFSGHGSAVDLKSTITVIDPKSNDEKIEKFVLINQQQFRLGKSCPEKELAEDILNLVAGALKYLLLRLNRPWFLQ